MTSLESNNNDNKILLDIKTVQANAIRILFESLKDILNDVNIKFTQEDIKIVSMDGSKNAVIHLKLLSEKFEHYYCKSAISAGVNMNSLFKIIKSMKNNDIIRFFIQSNDINKLNIQIENKEKKTIILTQLKLLDIDDDILKIPDIKFNSVINMPSNDFQSHIRELAIITNQINITSNNGMITLQGDGDFANTNITVGEKTENKDENLIVTGKFNIKYLLLFTKSTNLCTTVEIYLKNNYPLILVYNVANLGTLKYVLTPLLD